MRTIHGDPGFSRRYVAISLGRIGLIGRRSAGCTRNKENTGGKSNTGHLKHSPLAPIVFPDQNGFGL